MGKRGLTGVSLAEPRKPLGPSGRGATTWAPGGPLPRRGEPRPRGARPAGVPALPPPTLLPTAAASERPGARPGSPGDRPARAPRSALPGPRAGGGRAGPLGAGAGAGPAGTPWPGCRAASVPCAGRASPARPSGQPGIWFRRGTGTAAPRAQGPGRARPRARSRSAHRLRRAPRSSRAPWRPVSAPAAGAGRARARCAAPSRGHEPSPHAPRVRGPGGGQSATRER